MVVMCSFPRKFLFCVTGKRSLQTKLCKLFSDGRIFLCTSYQQDNVKRTEKNSTLIDEEAENKVPVSLLGMGIGKCRRMERSSLKKILNPVEDDKPTNEPMDTLPVAVKLMLQKNKSEAITFYPDLKDFTHETYSEKCEKETVQQSYYPFKPFPSALLKERHKETVNVEEPKFKAESSSVMKYLSQHLGQSEELDEGINAIKTELWRMNYGRPDPSIPVSKVSCGGCGAYFHCQDSSLPGYIPSEKFKGLKDDELRKTICQRCIFFQHYNIALNISVDPSEYPKLISEIKDKIALVILIVDLLDFPCSIWPGIIDLIGPKRPIFVVGNKVDLLPCDSQGYLYKILLSLKQSLKDAGIDKGKNIKHVGLISAKTGYGVEQLINKLHKLWGYKGDVYLVGCTNVGKSTLFNTLLQSDYCKVNAIDLVQRATTSTWPGTTLNLLKFPIMKPTGFMLYLRTMRLKKERDYEREASKVRTELFRETRNPQYATLMGRIRLTMKEDFRSDDPLKANSSGEQSPRYMENVLNLKNPQYANDQFCYDTPGAVYKDQILSMLTTEEISKVLPKQIVIPRTFILREHQTFFLGGLARIDLLEIKKGPESRRWGIIGLYITVFASSELPAHIVYTHEADLFYKMNLGTVLLTVPSGGPERLKDFPALEGKDMEVSGEGFDESCADIVLSSAGWVSITLGMDTMCKLKAYTPEGRGCYLRQPAMLKSAVRLRGKRIKGTPAYENTKYSIHQTSRFL